MVGPRWTYNRKVLVNLRSAFSMIGQAVRFDVNGYAVAGRIVDARSVYGRVQVQVSQDERPGRARWIDAGRVVDVLPEESESEGEE